MTSRRPSLRRSVALVWRTLRSMRTALVLLLVLAGGAVIGSLLPQIPNSPQRVGQYLDGHGFWGPLFFRAGFFDVYGSWWFVLITTLLFVSLAACLLPRTRALLRAARQRPVQARELDGFRHHVRLSGGATPDDVADGAERLLRRRRFRVARDGAGVAGEKGVLREAGSLLFHWAFFLLLVGVMVGEGTVVTASIDGHRLWGSPIQMVRDDAPEGVPATAMPWRGAIKLTEPEPDVMVTLELWPDFRALANLQLTGRRTPMLVEFDPYLRYSVYTGRILDPARSTIMPVGLRRIGRGQIHAAGTGSISVPGVGDLRLAFPELRHYSVLLVSRDVGVPVVLAAAILVLVGLLPALFVSRRKVWIRAEPAPGGSTVEVGGFALQRKDAFEEEFARIVRAVEASAGAVPARPSEPVGTP